MHITQLIIKKEIIIARLDGIFDCIYRVMSVTCIKKMIDIWQLSEIGHCRLKKFM